MSRIRFFVGSAVLATLVTVLAGQTAPAPAPATPRPDAAAAAKPLSELKIELMDGSVLAGKLSIPTLDIDTKFGALKVPVEQIQSFAPGLNSHPKFQQHLNTLLTDLSSEVFADREKAQQTLTKLGPEIRPEIERQVKSAENEKQLRMQKILDDFDGMSDEDYDKSRNWTRDDVIVTQGFTIVGHITTPAFSINSNYGTLQIKLEDVRLARREAPAPEDIRKNVSVPGTCFGNRQYINTNIKLAKGDQVTLTASGTIQLSPWNQQSGPDGTQNVGNVGNGIFGGTLVYKVGDSGPMIRAGSKLQFTASQPGTLQLGIASPGSYEGNPFPGEYEVKIRIVKK